jgi:hypothetical protein
LGSLLFHGDRPFQPEVVTTLAFHVIAPEPMSGMMNDPPPAAYAPSMHATIHSTRTMKKLRLVLPLLLSLLALHSTAQVVKTASQLTELLTVDGEQRWIINGTIEPLTDTTCSGGDHLITFFSNSTATESTCENGRWSSRSFAFSVTEDDNKARLKLNGREHRASKLRSTIAACKGHEHCLRLSVIVDQGSEPIDIYMYHD